MWCLNRAAYLEFTRELVSSFLARHCLSLTAHAVVKVGRNANRGLAHEVLLLGAYLEPAPQGEHLYFLTEPEVPVDVWLNPYTRQALETTTAKLSFFVSRSLTVPSLWLLLLQIFSGTPAIAHFALYAAEETIDGAVMKQAPPHWNIGGRARSLHLQVVSAFALETAAPPAFSNSFFQLRYFSSSLLFAKQYQIELFGHFLCATKHSRRASPACTLEITADLKVHQQVVGRRVFAVIEHNGAKWTLYHRNRAAVAELLAAIARAPRHQPRLVEPPEKRAWQAKCAGLEELLQQNRSHSSLHQILALFPRELPRAAQISDQEHPEALLRKLKSHLQRSIWDNVTIEFIVYLLSLQQVPLAADLQREIRAFAAGRKQILAQVKQMRRQRRQ